MKIDFDHYKGAQIGDEIQNQQDLERRLSIIKTFNPKLTKDGDQYCFLYGELPNDCIIGFGNTVHDAMNAFVNNFYNEKEQLTRSENLTVCWRSGALCTTKINPGINKNS